MVFQVITDERADEIITVIITGVIAQRQLLSGFLAGLLQPLGMQLFGQELIVQSLIHQNG